MAGKIRKDLEKTLRRIWKLERSMSAKKIIQKERWEDIDDLENEIIKLDYIIAVKKDVCVQEEVSKPDVKKREYARKALQKHYEVSGYHSVRYAAGLALGMPKERLDEMLSSSTVELEKDNRLLSGEHRSGDSGVNLDIVDRASSDLYSLYNLAGNREKAEELAERMRKSEQDIIKKVIDWNVKLDEKTLKRIYRGRMMFGVKPSDEAVMKAGMQLGYSSWRIMLEKKTGESIARSLFWVAVASLTVYGSYKFYEYLGNIELPPQGSRPSSMDVDKLNYWNTH